MDGISFDLSAGEVVGFLGPNGAGKTTTLKMLSGLLHPTAGEVSVLGHAPSRREKDFLRQITLVMGQRNQLVWDIPAADSFELNRAIYRIPRPEFRRTLDELVALLELGPLLGKPVRNLSLGERMKCEIAAALLHRPRVVFLDEPTIGLDVTMQRRIRAFLARIQPALRRHDPPHQPLHGGRGGAVPARARHPPRQAPLRRGAGRARPAVHRAQDHRGAAPGLHGGLSVYGEVVSCDGGTGHAAGRRRT